MKKNPTELMLHKLVETGPQLTPLQISIVDFLFTLRNPATRAIYARVLKDYLKFLQAGGLVPSEIEQLDHKFAHVFMNHLQTKNSPSTVYDKMMILSSWYRFEVDRGHLQRNPISLLKLSPNHEPMNPTPALDGQEIEAIKAHLAAHCARSIGKPRYRQARMYHCIFNLLLATGARISSICALKVKDIELTKEGTELILTVKGGGQGRIILHPKAALILHSYIAEFVGIDCPSLPMFLGRGGAITPRAVNYHFKQLAENLDLKTNFHPHVMRATMATVLHDHNVSMIDVKNLGLWQDSRMPESYVRIKNRKLHAASAKMPL
jgi:site-specific recombinase XerD